MTQVLHRPGLLAIDENGTIDLRWQRCPACDAANLSVTRPGCAVCGAAMEGGTMEVRPARGILREAVWVHIPAIPGVPPPVAVAEVALSDGWIDEAPLDPAPGAELPPPGTTVRLVAHPRADGTLDVRWSAA